MPSSRLSRVVAPVLLAMLVLSACQRDGGDRRGDADAARAAPSPTAAERFELTWQGVLPCADCAGIDTRLVLRRDGPAREFELVETYLGVDGDNQFVERGAWSEGPASDGDGAATVYRLGTDPAGRRFQLRPDGALDLLGADGAPVSGGPDYRLQRM